MTKVVAPRDLAEYLDRARRHQLADLGGNILTGHGNSGININHGQILHRIYEPGKSIVSQRRIPNLALVGAFQRCDKSPTLWYFLRSHMGWSFGCLIKKSSRINTLAYDSYFSHHLFSAALYFRLLLMSVFFASRGHHPMQMLQKLAETPVPVLSDRRNQRAGACVEG